MSELIKKNDVLQHGHFMKLLVVAGLLLLPKLCFASGSYLLNHEKWSLPKKTENVIQMKSIKHVLSDFDKSPTSELLILYPGGDEGTLWANEVKAWLVSLGVSSRQIELRPGSSDSNVIEMRVDSPTFDMIKAR